jgi:hypothetical protein
MTGAGGPGRWLRVVAIGHAVVGGWLYRDVLAATAGEVRRRGPAALVGAVPERGDRATAFWFLVAAPTLWSIGRTLEPGDRAAGTVLAATGVAGSVLMPGGGFPAVAALGTWAALTRRRGGAGERSPFWEGDERRFSCGCARCGWTGEVTTTGESARGHEPEH